MKIYRNTEGKCVNIGDWDYQIVVIDGVETIRNPLPEGVHEDDAEVIVGWDGGLYAVDDPRAVKS
jgi:hypothetical protein